MTARDLIFIGFSLALHGALVALLLSLPLALPDDFEFALPTQVEFGIIEELEAEIAEPEPEPEPEPARPSPKTAGLEPAADRSDEAREAEPEPEPERLAAPQPAPRIPAGSQIALRIDMARVRDSRLEAPARKLIRQIPDWHLLAGGSGIDPVDGLDRLLIATPDPRRRDLIVLAGKSVGDESTIRTAAESIATAQGREIEFRRERGVALAPWHALDPTERVIAIVGPQHFTISKPEVVGTLLAMTAHRERAARAAGLAHARGADALLALGEGDAISIEVENVASYARRLPCPVPEKGGASIRETGSGVTVEAAVFHESEGDAREAAACWERVRAAYAGNLLVRVMGLGPPLDGAKIEHSESSVRVSLGLTDAQATQLLGLIGGQIARLTGYRPPPEPKAAATPASEEPPSEEPASEEPPSGEPPSADLPSQGAI